MYIDRSPGWPKTTVGGTLRVMGHNYTCLRIQTVVLPGRRYYIYYLTDGQGRVYRFSGHGFHRIERPNYENFLKEAPDEHA